MPAFLIAALATIAGNVGSDIARDRLASIRAAFASRRLGGPRFAPPPVRQVPPPRVLLTPPVSPMPVPWRGEVPIDGPTLAGRLAARR